MPFNFMVITYLSSLKDLNLSKNLITDPSSLKDLSELEKLDLSNNKISQVTTISGFPSDMTLNLTGNPLTNSGINFFYDYCFLSKLGIPIPSEHLGTLKVLQIIMKAEGTDPENCTAADEWAKSVTSLNLSNKSLGDISPLAFLTSLKSLNLAQNHISKLEPLASLAELSSLNLEKNNVVDVVPLSGLSNLESLNLYKNQIISSFSLGGLKNLRRVDLRENKIKTLDKIKRLMERAKDRGALNLSVPVGVYLKGNNVCSLNFVVIPTGNPILDQLQGHNKKLNIVKARACTEIPPAE